LTSYRDLNHAAEPRSVGQEPTDFQVGVDALLEPAKELEDEQVAEDHRSIALLGLDDDRFEKIADRIEQRPECRYRQRHDLARWWARTGATGRGRQQCKRELAAPHCIVEHPFRRRVASLQPGDDDAGLA